MNISVYPVDAKIPNLALMRLSAWHKQQGDTVKIHEPLLDTPDRLYLSKQFDFTDDYPYQPDCEIVRGGTGYDLTTLLTDEQDTIYPDYSLFDCEYALGRITRGCPRACDWCIVAKQDGTRVHQVAELDDFLRDQDVVRLLDDNIMANRELFISTCNSLAQRKVKVWFDALDIRFVTPETAHALSKIKVYKNILRFAFDTVECEPHVLKGIKTLNENGVKSYKLTFYVLIGFNTTPEQDLYRVMLLKSLGVNPFVMPFDKTDPYQRNFARWCNRKMIFKSCTWDEYQKSQFGKA